MQEIEEFINNYKDLRYRAGLAVRSFEAKQKLDAGFTGMGANICMENAGALNHYMRKLKELLDKINEDE